MKRLNRSGFTIVELMIATSVFSVILLIVAAGIINFTNQYYKGITGNNTQTTARTIINQVSQALQFSQGSFYPLTANGVNQGYCINGAPYYYSIGQELGTSGVNHVLVTSNDSCPPAAINLATLTFPGSMTNPRELMGSSMRLGAFTITQSGSLYTINVDVIYGDNDLLTTDPTGQTLSPAQWAAEQCKGGAGSQFCAVSDLTTTVEERL